jgi:Mg2+ and Co2+ transporter CorA
MRIFAIENEGLIENKTLQHLVEQGLPQQGFVWISCSRSMLESELASLQSTLFALCGVQLLDLHARDLLNSQLPSHYDYTSEYDILIFRRLAAAQIGAAQDASESGRSGKRSGLPILRRIDTSPVGFAVFDRLLLTVHPDDCSVREGFTAKLIQSANTKSHASGAATPTDSADLMLRIVNHMVDGYLALRRDLTRQLDHWQSKLLNPKTRFNNWSALLDARLALHQLDEVCEDQRASIQDWIEAVKTWPEPTTAAAQRDRELLQVRSRDVLEHIERVVRHVQRLEQNAETAVQMHFNAQSNRTNDIMRTLTVLTAVFLPLNLMAGIFGMNFEFMPVLHLEYGFELCIAAMVLVAVGLIFFFWRKHYLELKAPR